jgi:hypothetical protein
VFLNVSNRTSRNGTVPRSNGFASLRNGAGRFGPRIAARDPAQGREHALQMPTPRREPALLHAASM